MGLGCLLGNKFFNLLRAMASLMVWNTAFFQKGISSSKLHFLHISCISCFVHLNQFQNNPPNFPVLPMQALWDRAFSCLSYSSAQLLSVILDTQWRDVVAVSLWSWVEFGRRGEGADSHPLTVHAVSHGGHHPSRTVRGYDRTRHALQAL